MALKLNKEQNKVIILSPTYDVIKTCELLDIECFKLNHISQIEMIKHPNKTKKSISGIINMLGEQTLYFTHTQFDVMCFLLVKERAKCGPVKFFNFEMEYDVVKWPLTKIS
jgi:hypothetical protein